MQRKKVIKTVLIILIPVIILSFVVSFFNWDRNYNKNKLLQKYIVDNKEFYILGTIEKKHFNKIYNYSMKDMLGVIETIKPDLAMIEAREDHYIRYGIVDGKIDACVAYSYCFENKIPVSFVNWWIIDNIYPANATTNLQDDNIFIKVSRNIKESAPGSRLLLLIDSSHFYEMTNRFEIAGFKRVPIENKSEYFHVENEKFKFPAVVAKTWRDRNYFFSYNFPTEVKNQKDLNQSVKDKFLNADHDKFYLQEIEYCKYLNNDILYK